MAAPGAPSLAETAGSAPVIIITEVLADPDSVLDAAGEWFEVYNAGTVSANLKEWRIGSNNANETHTIAADVIVPAGGYAILGSNANQTTNGGVVVEYQYPAAFQLNNSNTDWITIKRPDTTASGIVFELVDSVAWAARTNGTPASFSFPRGRSRELKNILSDNSVLADTAWQTASTPINSKNWASPHTGPGGTVEPGEIVTVTVPATTMNVGSTRQLTAVARDANSFQVGTTFTWSIDNPAIATVNPATGAATALALGSATVTARAPNGVEGSGTLTVAMPQPGRVSVSMDSPLRVPVGYTKPAFADVFDADGTRIDPEPVLTWTSDNTEVATVDQLGYVTGVGVGSTTIRVTAPNNVVGTLPFTVRAADFPTNAVYRNHLEFGTATDVDPSDDIILAKRQYVVSYNPRRGGPNWVAWELNGTQFGTAPRCNCFSPDAQLPSNLYHVWDFDYRNGGYDRGHMVMSEERTTTDQENAATFLFTNILPQAANTNQGPWLNLETYLNDIARDEGKVVYVLAGGIWSASPMTLKGEGKVAIPDYTWKVALIMNAGDDRADVDDVSDIRVIAVKMPNLVGVSGPASADGVVRNSNTPWQQYETTVNALEAATGYDFLSLLPDEIEIPVEAKDRPPVASIAGPSSGAEGSLLAFDGSASSDPDGDALTYAWDFGDGASSTEQSPSHRYADNGTYVVTLTVKDPAGAFHVATRSVAVANVAPSVSLALDGPATIVSGAAASVRGGFADPGADAPWQWSIDWGAGTPTTGSAAAAGTTIAGSRNLLAAGSYTVTLTVRDKDGASGARSVAVQVMRLTIPMDVGPSSMSVANGGNGKLPVMVLASGTFDPGLVRLATVRIGSVGVATKPNGTYQASREDVNGDGLLDLVLHFDRAALVRAGAVGDATTELELLADLEDGRQVVGRAALRPL
jgi:DNA/RNA endonuclease G (NUC1)